MNISFRRDRNIGEVVAHAELAGGTRLLVIPKPGMTRQVAIAAFPFGSIDLSFSHPDTGERVTVPAGVAHFLEHQLFKKSTGDLSDDFARLGANNNAVTDLSTTSYHFVATESFDENLDILLRIVLEPHFTEENVEKERPIVASEIRMGEESPDTRVMNALLEGMYQRHPVRIDVPGTVESIQDITVGTLSLCHKAFYSPAEMIVVAAGNLDPEAVGRRVEEALARHARVACKVERFLPEEPPGIGRAASETRMSVPRPKILVGWKDVDLDGGEEMLACKETITGVALDLLFGKGSRLHARLYDQGLIDDSFAFTYFGHPSYGFTIVGSDTDDPERLRDELLQGVRRARREGVRKRDLERMRRKYMGRYLRGWDNPESIAFSALAYAIRGADVLGFPRWLRRASARAVSERIESHLSEERMAWSLALPRE